MDQPSSWALAPERGIDKLQKEELSEWDGIYNEVPSFRPELMSSPEQRQKARSSRYGSEIPVVKKVVLKDDDLRPWQEVPTFKPELEPCEARKNARSSKYGKKIPIRKETPQEIPAFKPEVSRPKTAQKMYKQARSSGYGRLSIEHKKPKTEKAPSFRPKLSSSKKLRGKAKSSQYGKKTAASRAQSTNASPSKGKAFDSFTVTPKYTPRYSLLADKSHEDSLKISSPDREDGGFILDGMRHANSLSRLHDSFNFQEAFLPPHSQLKIRQKAASSKYGVASPAVGQRVEKHTEEGRFTFDASSSSLNGPHQPFTARNSLTDKARSSKYGVTSPAQGPKPQVRPSSPKWNVNVKSTAWGDEAPSAPVNKQTESARSHKYGVASPARGNKYEYRAQPLWLPSGKKSNIGDAAPPVPRSSLNDQVVSHYGKHYDPSSLYAFNGDEEFDDEVASSAPEYYDDEDDEGEYEVEGGEEHQEEVEEEEEEEEEEGGEEGEFGEEEVEMY